MDKTFTKPRLRELSQKLLQLHKALLEYQKREYREKFGRADSPGKLLELLMESPHFAWLRALSGLVAGIDEIVDSKEPEDAKQIADLIAYTRGLLGGHRLRNDFSKKYLAALQQDPHVALAHGQAMGMLKK